MSKTIRAVSIVLFLGIVLAANTPLFAQSTGNATLRGTVKDPQGALINNAIVTITNEATRDDRKAKTNDSGLFVLYREGGKSGLQNECADISDTEPKRHQGY